MVLSSRPGANFSFARVSQAIDLFAKFALNPDIAKFANKKFAGAKFSYARAPKTHINKTQNCAYVTQLVKCPTPSSEVCVRSSPTLPTTNNKLSELRVANNLLLPISPINKFG
jgi:hypothetical protein